jgi:hypothetical protein
LCCAVTPGAAVRAASLPHEHPSPSCVTFLSLVTRISLAGAVDVGGTEGAVIAYSTLIDPPYTLSVSAYACMCNVPAECALPRSIPSCGSDAGRRSPRRRLNTIVFYTKISNSEVRHDFHNNMCTITGSHTILYQKLLFQPRKSGVTISASDRQD